MQNDSSCGADKTTGGNGTTESQLEDREGLISEGQTLEKPLR